MRYLQPSHQNHGKSFIISDNRGQSTVEYLVVTFVVIAALITSPSIYKTVSETMANKYHSYAFGIAISDPPRKAFDDEIKKNTGKVSDIFDVLDEIEDLISNSIIPDLSEGKLPSMDDITKFGALIKSLF